MDFQWSEWIQFFLRWIHLIAGISWIGNSFYFMWLDSSFKPADTPKEGVQGEVWMVHGGMFYLVEKHQIRPGGVPRLLHWFKWEATFTWLSGFFLLAVVYYLGGGIFLVDANVARLSPLEATVTSLGLILGCWFFYDLLWQSSLAKKKSLATALSLALVCALAFILTKTFSGRAAFIHLGAIFGTLMVLNVWVRILPAQRRMITASEQGKTPDYNEGTRAKWRSTHNSYMTLPVLFTMVSNHLPAAYGHSFNWVILLLLCLLGGLIRHMMLRWNQGKVGYEVFAPIGIVIFALLYLTMSAKSPHASLKDPVPFSHVNQIIQKRCISCHSAHPTDVVFKVAPSGIMFDDPESIRLLAERIKYRTYVTKTMPLANKTEMTDSERLVIHQWVAQGAPLGD